MPRPSELQEIERTLEGRHGCHTVILYGSRVRGDARPESDWDVVGVREKGESVREVRPLGEGWLDAFVYPEAHFATLDEGSLRFRRGEILVDRKGFAKQLVARIAAFEDKGPAPLSPDAEATLRAWYPKMLGRIAREDVEGRYRRAWLLFEALEAWFRLRKKWYRGPKESFAWLAANEPPAHAIFARALDPASTLDDLSALVACVLGD
ncbi:MAG: nucleotidyltransferase domain-containing protein [Polyangiales bacterium]